jgi:hypothetical protein
VHADYLRGVVDKYIGGPDYYKTKVKDFAAKLPKCLAESANLYPGIVETSASQGRSFLSSDDLKSRHLIRRSVENLSRGLDF